jgi:hypothetical protein
VGGIALPRQSLAPEHTHPLPCRHSADSLTVTVFGPSGDLGGHPDQVAEIWSNVH